MALRVMRALRRLGRYLPRPLHRRLRNLAIRGGVLVSATGDEQHPERLAVLSHLGGSPVLEVGCGPRKSRADFVAVDLIPGGRLGIVGNAAGRPSEADIAANGASLPFAPGTFGTLVARHNLEHYVDLVAVLREWKRVLRPGGKAVVIVPDEDAYAGRTLDLDPTHFHSFNASFARGLFDLLGWQLTVIEPCIPGWSLLIVAEARGADAEHG
jgi:SAM-dependent methyltransferase